MAGSPEKNMRGGGVTKKYAGEKTCGGGGGIFFSLLGLFHLILAGDKKCAGGGVKK